jgi:hypothetical protein
MPGSIRRLLASAVLLLLLGAGCGPSVPPPKSTPGAPVASEAVERFLRLAAQRDYVEMGWIFGTKQGAIIQRDPPADVERRMFAMARVLENERFEIRGENPVPGSVGASVRVDVRLHNRGRTYNVPFTTVRGPRDRWYVEQVALEAITGAR